ncbi:hypothetical protein C2S52_014888 [Perilla frutescens var. hirtella]|nr:hypothetical protein C2S52_014888 [Perilla frutescens var. hirtella]
MNNFNDTSIENETLKPATGTSSGGGPSTPTVTTAAAATTNSNMSIIFDDPTEENDISAAIDFSTSPSFHHDHHQYMSSNNNNVNMNEEALDISSLNNQLPLGDMATTNGSSLHTAHQYGHERWSLSSSYEEECLSSYMGRLKSSQPAACSLIDTIMVPYLPPAATMNVPFSAETSGAFTGTALMLATDLEFQGDNTALFIPDNMQRVFNCSTDLQGLSSESQHLYHGGATASTTSALASEISSLEDPTFKVGKLSVEERKRKIHRYMKKRNERNFSKKIKYACRKTLADSRPRVRGRFAKNDELLGEIGRNMGSNNEDDVDEDVGLYSNSIHDHKRKVVVKEEDDQDSSDILAHISGVNSFKCNYPIQSWI